MKYKRPIILIGIGVLLALLAWYFTAPTVQPERIVSIEHERLCLSNAVAASRRNMARAGSLVIEKPGRMPHLITGFVPMGMPTNGYAEDTNDVLVTIPVIDPKYSNPANWPDDPRPQVKALYAFAQTTKAYKFDPTVSSVGDSKSARGVGFFDTPTHLADVDAETQRLSKFSSKFDRLGSMAAYSDATDDWGDATGKWNQSQIVGETFRILRELGLTYADTLQAVSKGRSEVKLHEWRIKTADGQLKLIYPFATVKLYGPNVSGDANQPPRVSAQFRMGSNGPVGLVDWFSLY